MPASGGETIGERIRRIRTSRGLSQRAVAGPGVSAAYISRIEAGDRVPSVKALRVIAPKLGVSVEFLETGELVGPTSAHDWRLSDAELKLRLDGDVKGAEADFREILGQAVDEGDEWGATRARIGLGLAVADRGASGEASELLEQAITHPAISPASHPYVFATLTQIYVTSGRSDRAVVQLAEWLTDLKPDNPDEQSAYVRFATYLSYALSEVGELDRARSVLDDAFQQAGEFADPYTWVRLYWSQARLASIDGEHLVAEASIRRAIALLEAMEDNLYLGRAQILYGETLVAEGRFDEAARWLQLADELLGIRIDGKERARLLGLRAELAASAAQFDEAVNFAGQALELASPADSNLRARASSIIGRAHASRGEIEEAVLAFQEAEATFMDSGPRDLAPLYVAWSTALEEAGRLPEALEVMKRATKVVGLNRAGAAEQSAGTPRTG